MAIDLSIDMQISAAMQIILPVKHKFSNAIDRILRWCNKQHVVYLNVCLQSWPYNLKPNWQSWRCSQF